MQRIVSAPRSVTAPLNSDIANNDDKPTYSHAGEIWKDRAHKLAKLVYDLEIQKLDFQKRLEMAKALQAENLEAADVAALHNELLQLKTKLEQQEEALNDREKMLKVAAGKARAEVLAMKAKAAEATGRDNAGSTGLIPALAAPQYMSPGKSAHVDVATLQSMLRQKEKELGVLREDNSAKQKELLHALELLQGAHKREGELRCQAQSLSNQLDLARDALQQSNSDIDTLQKEIEELGSVNTNDDGAQSALLVQLEATKAALAVARDDAELFKNKAARLESALQASEQQCETIQEKLALLQEYLTSLEDVEKEQQRRGSDNGRRAALGMTKTVLFAQLAVQGLSFVCKALSSSS